MEKSLNYSQDETPRGILKGIPGEINERFSGGLNEGIVGVIPEGILEGGANEVPRYKKQFRRYSYINIEGSI